MSNEEKNVIFKHSHVLNKANMHQIESCFQNENLSQKPKNGEK